MEGLYFSEENKNLENTKNVIISLIIYFRKNSIMEFLFGANYN